MYIDKTLKQIMKDKVQKKIKSEENKPAMAYAWFWH